ncbi:hypothetical protein KQI42_17480 [Tissierella sp. MSJ-40]|uniref:Uncharacterized protein n=1 Tax=Tissierella simiarum TaxID=2841534 RepID=A0ABS6EAC7_9FIRM|nr:hypothetical protein [Tissierella simiarum]MBU5439811.1 hypothetical protein [Tissierella simiarum]
MITIEEYILKMKKRDKLDEFNFTNHTDNMAKVIKYVMDYFNDYLDPETYNYEQIKIDQKALKIEQDIEKEYPNSKDFIVDYYRRYISRIDKTLWKFMEEEKYIDLFYCKTDYEIVIDKFCTSSKMKGTGIEQYRDNLIVLAQELKESSVEKPTISEYRHLDNFIVKWLKDTYKEYKVNLYNFAYGHTDTYYETYVEHIYDRDYKRSYYINKYNHRYNENPFDIEEVYTENIDRPFINGRKGELEILCMYIWLFDQVKDQDYWPEYINLNISTGRIKLVKSINVLEPIKYMDIQFPVDIKSAKVYMETTDGLLRYRPENKYILRLNYKKDNDLFWKDLNELMLVINNLKETFSKYGVPEVLELQPPLRSFSYNEEEFFEKYGILEKNLKKYSKLKITLINGQHRTSKKQAYLIRNVDDIVKIKNISNEMKFILKFTIDISNLMKEKNFSRDYKEEFIKLTEVRNSIIGIHISSIPNSYSISKVKYSEDASYLSKYNYPRNSDLFNCIIGLLNDNQKRYFVPKEIKNAYELEELVDTLLRGGFLFYSQEDE